MPDGHLRVALAINLDERGLLRCTKIEGTALRNSVLKTCLTEETFSVSFQFFRMSPRRGHNCVTNKRGHTQGFAFRLSRGCYKRKEHR